MNLLKILKYGFEIRNFSLIPAPGEEPDERIDV